MSLPISLSLSLFLYISITVSLYVSRLRAVLSVVGGDALSKSKKDAESSRPRPQDEVCVCVLHLYILFSFSGSLEQYLSALIALILLSSCSHRATIMHNKMQELDPPSNTMDHALCRDKNVSVNLHI